MLQSDNQSNSQRFNSQSSYAPPSTTTTPVEQATIGRSLVIKGEISGGESLYIDGRIEGSINFAEHRVTIGRNGVVAANIVAREVVIMGSVKGNIQCADRLDIRNEGTLTGDVVTQRISVEDGAVLKGSVQVRTAEQKHEQKNENKNKQQQPVQTKPAVTEIAQSEEPKSAAAVAGH